MPDVVIERKISLKSIAIIDALSSVDCGQDVFAALCEAPTLNLVEMLNMIKHILEKREELQ